MPKSTQSHIIDFHGQYGQRYGVYETDGKKITRILSPSDNGVSSWSPKQIEYFDSTFPHTLFGGARGGGKSEAIVFDNIFKAHLNPGCNLIIFRRIMGELERTIIERFKQLPTEVAGEYIGKQGNEHMKFTNGSKIYFGSAPNEDDVRKLLSGEYLMMTFDEWSEWPYNMWLFATGSNRTTKDKNALGEPIIAQVKGCTNPGGIGGDVLRDLFGCEGTKKAPAGSDPATYDPDSYLFIKALVRDNPAYAENKPAGIAYRKMLMAQPAARRAGWLEGRWSGFEGQYFDIFNKDASCIPHDLLIQLLAKQYWQPRWISMDWGRTHHSYASWHTFIELRTQDGVEKFPVTYREYLIKGLGESALAQEIADMTSADEKNKIDAVYLSPDTFGDPQLSRAERIAEVFLARGLPRPQKAFNKREDGWTLMHGLLRYRTQLANGWVNQEGTEIDYISRWLISDKCEHLINAIPWAMSDPKRDGDIVKEGDSPNLDILDGARYGIASRVEPEKKPLNERIKEQLAVIPPVGSGRYMRHLQLLVAEKEEANKALYYGPRFKRRR